MLYPVALHPSAEKNQSEPQIANGPLPACAIPEVVQESKNAITGQLFLVGWSFVVREVFSLRDAAEPEFGESLVIGARPMETLSLAKRDVVFNLAASVPNFWLASLDELHQFRDGGELVRFQVVIHECVPNPVQRFPKLSAIGVGLLVADVVKAGDPSNNDADRTSPPADTQTLQQLKDISHRVDRLEEWVVSVSLTFLTVCVLRILFGTRR